MRHTSRLDEPHSCRGDAEVIAKPAPLPLPGHMSGRSGCHRLHRGGVLCFGISVHTQCLRTGVVVLLHRLDKGHFTGLVEQFAIVPRARHCSTLVNIGQPQPPRLSATHSHTLAERKFVSHVAFYLSQTPDPRALGNHAPTHSFSHSHISHSREVKTLSYVQPVRAS
eukprot:363759-Chlamydomonas_euryale.AAC.14